MLLLFFQIVHLKRFQLLHGRWVKSHKIVKFPFENFDPTDYLAQVPKETILTAQSRKKRIKTEKSQTFSPQSTEHVDHDDKSTFVDHNGQSVHMDNKDKSTHVDHRDKCIHVDQNDKSVHIDNNDKSFLIDHNDNCATEVEKLSNQNDQSVPSQIKIDNNLFLNSCDRIPNCNGIDSSNDSLDIHLFSDLKDFHQHQLFHSDPFSLKYRLYALAVSIHINLFLIPVSQVKIKK